MVICPTAGPSGLITVTGGLIVHEMFDDFAQFGVQANLLGGGVTPVEPIHDALGLYQSDPADALDEFSDIIVLGVGNDFLGRADLNDLAVVHDGNVIAHADCLVEVMGDEEGGLVHMGRKLQELVLQLPPDQRIKRREGFVHQQDFRVCGQSAGETHTLLHAAGQLVGIVVDPSSQIHRFQGSYRCIVPLLGLDPAHLKAKAHVFPQRPVGPERHVLEHHADGFGPKLAQRVLVHRINAFTRHMNFARRWFDQPVHMTYECGFS